MQLGRLFCINTFFVNYPDRMIPIMFKIIQQFQIPAYSKDQAYCFWHMKKGENAFQLYLLLIQRSFSSYET